MTVRRSDPSPRGFLSRLARDTRGNAFMLMAGMIVPLIAFSGSAIDMARIYTVRSRLQQACDAGALAGRKSLNGTSLDTSASGQAQTFFNNNFVQGWLGTKNVSFTPSLTSDNQVQGDASVNVPMTIMAMFGQPTRAVTVTCIARYDVADADIMFVLDTTGSMACLPSDSNSTCNNYDGAYYTNSDANGSFIPEKTGSRIAGVRSAVLSFFDTVTGQADQTTNFRFGFVPFNVAVNVGKILYPMGYMATSWTYQSREVSADANSGSATTTTSTTTQANCMNSSTASPVVVRSPSTALTYTSSGTATNTTYTWSGGTCSKKVQNLIPMWQYQVEKNFPVSQYLGSSSGSPIDNPAQVDSTTTYWKGCVEERGTTAGATSFSTTSPPLDLDIDQAPGTSTTPMLAPSQSGNGYWGPMWSDVQFARNSSGENSSSTRDIYWRPSGYNNQLLYEGVACPLQVSRLSSITAPGSTSSSTRSSSLSTARTAIQTYLSASNGYRPWGSTYLDAGMVWGARMISPSGIFASDTAAWPGHNQPNRFLIFLTDGQMESDCMADASHGTEAYDQRVTAAACTSSGSGDTYHYNRLAAACTIAKNHNISVFVILFGSSVTTLPSQFTACASPGQAYYASDTTALNTAFSKIAAQVAMLRLSK